MRHSEFPHQQAVAEDYNGLCGNVGIYRLFKNGRLKEY